ncbi:hypothetical protein [Pedobacter sp. N36a]|uniref:hypothetical protein n=1 Tax=Pedobacter sp. N36a TaxID=2767996 RepID=UPI001656D6BF|nr:hypothetical protein [Pedobacter sp. N36a]
MMKIIIYLSKGQLVMKMCSEIQKKGVEQSFKSVPGKKQKKLELMNDKFYDQKLKLLRLKLNALASKNRSLKKGS